MNPEDYTAIRVEIGDDGVVSATLNRPDQLNAVIGRMHTEMSRLAADFDYDPSAKVLLITGEGRAFAAGTRESMMEFLESQDAAAPMSEDGGDVWFESRRIIDSILECRKPIVSAVNGFAMGLGANIALLCDVVVAGRSAVFADPHVNMGLGAGDGGQVIWPLLMGVNRAKYYLMTGEMVKADEAERLGLVNFVVDDDQLFEKAREIAARLARGPLQAIIASKVPINQWMRAQAAQILPLSMAMEGANFHTDDAQEARKAFLENRKPKFTGR